MMILDWFFKNINLIAAAVAALVLVHVSYLIATADELSVKLVVWAVGLCIVIISNTLFYMVERRYWENGQMSKGFTIKERDDEVRRREDYDVLKEAPRSVICGLTVEELAAQMPVDTPPPAAAVRARWRALQPTFMLQDRESCLKTGRLAEHMSDPSPTAYAPHAGFDRAVFRRFNAVTGGFWRGASARTAR